MNVSVEDNGDVTVYGWTHDKVLCNVHDKAGLVSALRMLIDECDNLREEISALQRGSDW